MVINLDSVKYTVLSLIQMERLLSYRITNEQYYKWQSDWAANQVTVRFDGEVTYLAKSIVCLTKCNSKVIVDYYYLINYYNYFQNEIHHYYYCEKCNRYYYYYNYTRSGWHLLPSSQLFQWVGRVLCLFKGIPMRKLYHKYQCVCVYIYIYIYIYIYY